MLDASGIQPASPPVLLLISRSSAHRLREFAKLLLLLLSLFARLCKGWVIACADPALGVYLVSADHLPASYDSRRCTMTPFPLALFDAVQPRSDSDSGGAYIITRGTCFAQAIFRSTFLKLRRFMQYEAGFLVVLEYSLLQSILLFSLQSTLALEL